MKTLLFLISALLPFVPASLARPSEALDLVGETLVCVDPSGALATSIRLNLVERGAYHRDGLWFLAEYNGLLIHTYVFVSSPRLDNASAWDFEAIIHRDNIRTLKLTEVRYTNDPVNVPLSFTGVAVRDSDGASVSLTCLYNER